MRHSQASIPATLLLTLLLALPSAASDALNGESAFGGMGEVGWGSAVYDGDLAFVLDLRAQLIYRQHYAVGYAVGGLFPTVYAEAVPGAEYDPTEPGSLYVARPNRFVWHGVDLEYYLSPSRRLQTSLSLTIAGGEASSEDVYWSERYSDRIFVLRPALHLLWSPNSSSRVGLSLAWLQLSGLSGEWIDPADPSGLQLSLVLRGGVF